MFRMQAANARLLRAVRHMEEQNAARQQLEADLVYIAMMCGIDLEQEDETDGEEQI